MGTARYGLDTNMGTLTAGLSLLQVDFPGTTLEIHEEWDGTNWSEQTDLSTGAGDIQVRLELKANCCN